MCLFARGAMYMVDNKSQFQSIPTDYQQCAVIQGDMASITQCITNTCTANDMRTDVLTGLNEFNTDCTTNNRKNFTRLVSCYETAVPLTTLLGNNTLTPASGVGSGIQGACAEAKQTIQTAKQNCPDLTSQEQDIYGIFTFALFTKYFGVNYQPYHSTCNV
uniref:DUF725 domain-containing protein n=1 Tax=Panagrellus redivivus TaxID=6233 RepID=A0A7E4VZ20_PANRE